MFSRKVLDLDCPGAVATLTEAIARTVRRDLHRRGVVIAMSGGIDSSVVAALCARALGPEQVVGLCLPEYDSAPESATLARLMARQLGIRLETFDIGPSLEMLGCYRYRDEAIRAVIPEFGPGWICKLVIPPITERPRYTVFNIVAQSPDGEVRRSRLPLQAYLQVIAATNMKQRTRKLIEYFHAERQNYAVVGTPNRLEYDQGFFVKYGDGAADLKPIAHLYKTQVYALAIELGVPTEIQERPPTTDTYSMAQTQEEFYFALPYDKMDLCLWAHNHQIPAAEVGPVVDLSARQVEQIFRDIDAKRRATRFLHQAPILVEAVPEVGSRPAADLGCPTDSCSGPESVSGRQGRSPSREQVDGQEIVTKVGDS